ncbi:LPXTG cell wall anchor domain-containing protein [Ilumatobacter coccineus]|uniref:LPXTG cell wall anchor domain-containing protein n=1 Tax=Ilumatobacter coccineus TaxID=467094 RepID=UPI00138ACBF4|nr:LPXTG cell wall anchor domain-containing protein [Ilumatobacter coccineus]
MSADTLPPIDPTITLPATGLGASTSALLGAAMLALGAALVGLSRRRQASTPTT